MPARRRLPLVLDLTPLIDVVFLLLLFFMVTTTFVNDTQGLRVDLPRSSASEAVPEGSDLRVALAADGGVAVDGVPVDGAALSAELRAAAEADPKTLVVLEADEGVPHGRVVQVLDLARGLGLTAFAIATETEGATIAPSLPDALRARPASR